MSPAGILSYMEGRVRNKPRQESHCTEHFDSVNSLLLNKSKLQFIAATENHRENDWEGHLLESSTGAC